MPKKITREEEAMQVQESSHTCWYAQGSWWARVQVFDSNHRLIQVFEGAHDTEPNANAWAEATERILVNVWIVEEK